MKLNVFKCYALAWQSFSKWWIPLCLISGIIIVFQVLPRILVRTDVTELGITARGCLTAFVENDRDRLLDSTEQLADQTGMLMRKLIRFTLWSFPLIALLTVALLMYANRAVKNRREPGRGLLVMLYIALVHTVVAVGKLLAFFVFVLPGVYLYVRLVFVSLVMLEDGCGAAEAIRKSWQMTRGNFWELFLLLLMNTGIQMVALPTVIGAIPSTGFVNTARAAAFRMLLEGAQPGATPPDVAPPPVTWNTPAG